MSLRTVCHFFAAVHFWFGCYYDWNYVKIPAEASRMGESFGFSGKLKFLTFWDALLQGFFFAICLLNDILGTNENVPKRTPLIRKFKDLILPLFLIIVKYINRHQNFDKGGLAQLVQLLCKASFVKIFVTVDAFYNLIKKSGNIWKTSDFWHMEYLMKVLLTSLAFPLAQFVAVTFWGLYFVDRELIFPKALDPYFPVWLNHVMHTNITIFILIELFTSFRKYPTRKQGISILLLFMVVYLVWIHIIHSYTGMWVYPILEVLNLPLRIVFFVVLFSIVVGLYILGEKLNALVWRKQLKVLKKA